MTDYIHITREASQYVEGLFEERKPLNLFFIACNIPKRL